MDTFELILVSLLLYVVFSPRSGSNPRVLVHAYLPIKVTWSDPEFRSKHFGPFDENPIVELSRYIWTPGKPQIGTTYKFLDTVVEVERARFEYPNGWEVRAKQVDTSRYPLKDDGELYEELMIYTFERGWEMPAGELGQSLKLEMEKTPKYFDRYRDFLQRRLAVVKAYKDNSGCFLGWWREKATNAELKRAIFDTQLGWHLMPDNEREKLPVGCKRKYRILIGKS